MGGKFGFLPFFIYIYKKISKEGVIFYDILIFIVKNILL